MKFENGYVVMEAEVGAMCPEDRARNQEPRNVNVPCSMERKDRHSSLRAIE